MRCVLAVVLLILLVIFAVIAGIFSTLALDIMIILGYVIMWIKGD